MKSSTGGALLMGFAAGIIIIFVIMVAFFISYGKSFKLKNELINTIEQREGMSSGELRNFMFEPSANRITNYNGKKIQACVNDLGDSKGFTIKIVVWMKMEKTILDTLFKPEIPIRGETRIIEKGDYYSDIRGLNLESCSRGYTEIVDV